MDPGIRRSRRRSGRSTRRHAARDTTTGLPAVVDGALVRRRSEHRRRLRIGAACTRARLATDDLLTGVGPTPEAVGSGWPPGNAARSLLPSAPMTAEHAHPVGARICIWPWASEYTAIRSTSSEGIGSTTVDGRLGVVVGRTPYVVGQSVCESWTETVEAAVGTDVVDAPEAVVVVTPDRTRVVVVLELLVPPHAASNRERAPSPVEMRMLRRTGCSRVVVGSEDCAPARPHRGESDVPVRNDGLGSGHAIAPGRGASGSPPSRGRNRDSRYCFGDALAITCWWRGEDLNLRPSGYEPDELPDCSTPRRWDTRVPPPPRFPSSAPRPPPVRRPAPPGRRRQPPVQPLTPLMAAVAGLVVVVVVVLATGPPVRAWTAERFDSRLLMSFW